MPCFKALSQLISIGSAMRAAQCLFVICGIASASGARAQSVLEPSVATANDFVQTLAVQSNGKLLVGGAFTTINGQVRSRLARLEADAGFDPTFQAVELNGTVVSVAALPGGKILIGGNFTQVRQASDPVGSYTTRNGIAQLNANGSLDFAFNPNALANGGQGNVFRILPLSSGKILVGGHFTNIGSAGRSKIARLNATGSVDTSFNAGAINTADYVWNLAEQPDGKLLVSGGFTQIAGVPRNNVARLHADGAIDGSFMANATFSTAGWYPSVNTTLLQGDGTIVITGQFDRVNGLARTNLARLNSNGSVDTSYSTANATNAAIHWGLTQPDGKVVIGGSFSSVAGVTRAKLARLNRDGALDPTFADQLVAGGDVYALARQTDGKIVAGGSFTHVAGQLRGRWAKFYGTALTTNATRYRQVVTGSSHSCGLTLAGAVHCWGMNEFGQLGDGTTNTRGVPAVVVGLHGGVEAITAGHFHTCAVSSAGAATCWGRNHGGQLGDGSQIDRLVPVPVSGLASGAHEIKAGDAHTCVRLGSGALQCWGLNTFGQLGDGTTVDRLTPTQVSGLTTGMKTVSAGGGSTCALTTLGAAVCWGKNSLGQLGDGSQIDRSLPVAVVGLAGGVQSIAMKHVHACAVAASGIAKCWGYNGFGQLGDGTASTFRVVPTDVAGLNGPVREISTGLVHSCAITAAGAAWCWGGWQSFPRLGNGTGADRSPPVPVTGLGDGVQQLDAGDNPTCAIDADGEIQCWGCNHNGELGDGTYTDRFVPVPHVRYAYLVSPQSGAGGSLANATPALVDAGTAGRFVVTPNPNHHVVSVGGTCGGTLSGNVFTTDIIGGDCSVVATFGIDTWTVTPSVVGGHGSITPATPQTINGGSTAAFTLTPEVGYVPTVGGTCGGNLVGNVYSTNAITANCTVIGSFTLDTRTVTPSVLGGHGTITPLTPQTVSFGATISFTLAPDAGYVANVSSASGSCGGVLSGNVYTTTAVTTDCTVIASFTLDTRTVTPSVAGGHGTITPATAQTVAYGSTASFALAADSGHVGHVAGTCGGTLAGNVYTTNAITTNCTVIASFASVQASLTINNNRSYSRYGMTLNYLVTLLNSGATDLTGTLGSLLPSQLDNAASTWICVEPGIGVQCTATGSGSLNDTVVVPAGRSVSWLVSAPVRMNALEPGIDYSVTFTSGLLPTPISAIDSDTLVLFRHGVDREYDDGSEVPADVVEASIDEPLDATAGAPGIDSLAPATNRTGHGVEWDGRGVIVATPSPATVTARASISALLVAVAIAPAELAVDAPIDASAPTSQGIRVERLVAGTRQWLRMVTIDGGGTERSSRWARINETTTPALLLHHDESRRRWVLDGAVERIEMLASTAPQAPRWTMSVSPTGQNGRTRSDALTVCAETCELLQ